MSTDPLFWRVEPDGGATLHLLGSIHIGPPRGWVLPRHVGDAFEASDTLVVEVDAHRASTAERVEHLDAYALAPSGSTLADLVPAETWAALEAHLVRRGGIIESYLPMRPWWAARLLQEYAVEAIGFRCFEGVEMIFLTRRGDREVVALESAASRQDAFAGFSPEAEVKLLQATLDGMNESEGALLHLAEAWRRGDELELERLVEAPFGSAPEDQSWNEAFLYDRNARMAEQLKAMARDPDAAGRSAFVVVGVAHFVGEHNVRKLLAEDGLRIEQLGPVASRAPTR